MSRIRKSFLVAVLLAGAAALPTLGQEREDGMSVPDEHTMIFFAVLEGLYRDGASNEAVDAILRQDDKGGYIHFVYGCPICTPALDALLVYRKRAKFTPKKGPHVDTLGGGLPKTTVKRLLGADPKERLDTIHNLLAKWVGRRVRLMRLTELEQGYWRGVLEDGRKRGMSVLRDDSSFVGSKRCAVCDGANDVWQK